MLKKIRGLFGRRSPKDAKTETEPAVVHRGPQVVHQTISSSDLDPDAVKIVERLTRFEHNAYLVGGCVRDLLLDRHPKDFDIATSATPRQIKRVFRNCRIIGRRFRLAHIYFQDGKIIEVATFRSANADFGGGRDKTDGKGEEDLMIRDDNVFGTPEEDALRRDFTINSLFYDLNNETVLDHANGLDDLRRRLVRTIGSPSIRFSEDPIRILRAIKFAGRLDFGIETETLEALRERASEIPKAAAPRILEEINRFGREGHAQRCFELLREYGVFEVILPELQNAYRKPEAWPMLDGLLAGIDRRSRAGQEIQTGEILAALLLPALAATLGWSADGTAELPKGLDLRDAIDAVLRPLSLRLRVSRREQERCRQIIAILARMVPAERVRKSTRRMLLRRINFLEALWMLEILGGHYGNAFDAAYDSWRTGAAEAEERRKERREARAGEARESRSAERGERSGGEGSGRRRRRRGGRRRGGRGRRGGGGEAEDRPAATATRDEQPAATTREASPRKSDKPAGESRGRKRGSREPSPSTPAKAPQKWDDDYFFSALPSAPVSGGDEGGDRYGAQGVAAEGSNADARDSEATDVPEDGTANAGDSESGAETRPRRRRRRRRRRKGPRPAEQDSDARPAPDKDDNDS